MLSQNITRWLERVKIKRGLKEEIASLEKRKVCLGKDILELERVKVKIKEYAERKKPKVDYFLTVFAMPPLDGKSEEERQYWIKKRRETKRHLVKSSHTSYIRENRKWKFVHELTDYGAEITKLVVYQTKTFK